MGRLTAGKCAWRDATVGALILSAQGAGFGSPGSGQCEFIRVMNNVRSRPRPPAFLLFLLDIIHLLEWARVHKDTHQCAQRHTPAHVLELTRVQGATLIFVTFGTGVCDPVWSATANYAATCAPAVPSADCMWWIYKRPAFAAGSSAAAASGGGVALAAAAAVAVAAALGAARRG